MTKIKKSLSEALPPDLIGRIAKSRLGAEAKLGDKVERQRQKLQLLQEREARENLLDKVAIGNAAEEVGLTAIAFSGMELRGALLTIVGAAANETVRAGYADAGREWMERRRRSASDLDCFVFAEAIGADFAAECRKHKLARRPVPAGFGGRLGVAELIEIGTGYDASVTVLWQNRELLLVSDGKVDEAVRSLLPGAAPGEVESEKPAELPTAGENEASAAAAAAPVAAEPATAPSATPAAIDSGATSKVAGAASPTSDRPRGPGFRSLGGLSKTGS